MPLTSDMFQEIAGFIAPHVIGRDDQAALLSDAFRADHPIYRAIVFGLEPGAFAVNLLSELVSDDNEGRDDASSLIVLLQVLRQRAGQKRAARIGNVIRTLSDQHDSNRSHDEGNTTMTDNSMSPRIQPYLQPIKAKREFEPVKQQLIRIMTTSAGLANDSERYYKQLLRKSNWPENWIYDLQSRLEGHPSNDTLEVVRFATSKNTNPETGRDALGDILLNLYDEGDLEQRNFMIAVLSGYRLTDTETLARLGVPLRLENTPDDHVTGPGFIWYGELNPERETEYQNWFRPVPEFQDVGFLTNMIRCSRNVCLIEIKDKRRYGTGVLIGRDLVLTAFHTFSSDAQKPQMQDLRETNLRARITFNYYSGNESAADDAIEIDVGEAMLQESPTSQLDFILLRLNRLQKNFNKLNPSMSVESRKGLSILQHPAGDTMKLAIGLTNDTITYVNQQRGIFQYVTRTSGGSSGAPCFDDDWNFVGIHHAERARTFGTIREGILYQAIEPRIRNLLS